MASQHFHVPLTLKFFGLLFIIVTFSRAQIDDLLTKPLVLPITKDISTLQYLTTIHHGDSLLPTTLVLDLNGPLSWMDCDSTTHDGSFPSRRIMPRVSIQCLAAKPRGEGDVSRSSSCGVLVENKIGRVGNLGELVEAILAVDLIDRSTRKFLYVCGTKSLLHGLAKDAKGMLGLGKSRVSFPSQISSMMVSHNNGQFSMCLSSSNGVVLVENSYFSSYFGSQIKNSMVYTPILTGQGESQNEYFINLRSINVGGKKLSLDVKTTKLSTIVPYTTMQSSTYEVFAKAYEKAALAMNMTRVDSVGPFGLCFGPKPNGPEIELIMQSEMVKWRLNGRNIFMRVSEEVMCLGFLDGGLDLEASIVLGGYQLEDFVLHFDVGNSMLGFSPSLLKWQKSCSDFKFESLPLESM